MGGESKICPSYGGEGPGCSSLRLEKDGPSLKTRALPSLSSEALFSRITSPNASSLPTPLAEVGDTLYEHSCLVVEHTVHPHEHLTGMQIYHAQVP